VIINNRHTGVLHNSDIFRELKSGERLQGYVKTIRPDNKIDVMLGERGYQKVSNEADKILELLCAEGGFLPFNDKSSPEDIYETFGISKKTFKMTIGRLYKEQKLDITQGGIKLIE
jgi:predicted RNA-binding protein (virulence factor B family)